MTAIPTHTAPSHTALSHTALSHTVVDSPLGPLTLVASGEQLCGVYFDDQRHGPHRDELGTFEPGGLQGRLAGVSEQLAAYFDGDLTTFDVSLAPKGTPFQLQVWAALRQIPYGQTRSYGEIAASLGRPGAARAVGLANGRNPIGIIVPCHRVVGADGSLTGYGGGLPRKQALLDLEAKSSRLFT